MYCLQGNLRPFLKPFSIFCHWENKTDFKKKHPPSKKKPTTKEPKKTTKKAKKTKNLFKSMKVCVHYCVLVNSIRNKTGKKRHKETKKISYLLA